MPAIVGGFVLAGLGFIAVVCGGVADSDFVRSSRPWELLLSPAKSDRWPRRLVRAGLATIAIGTAVIVLGALVSVLVSLDENRDRG